MRCSVVVSVEGDPSVRRRVVIASSAERSTRTRPSDESTAPRIGDVRVLDFFPYAPVLVYKLIIRAKLLGELYSAFDNGLFPDPSFASSDL